MPRLGSEDDHVAASVIGRWRQTAADEVDDIGGWREDAAERIHHASDPTCEWGDIPEGFYTDTAYLFGWITAHFPKLDPTSLQDVYSAIAAWHEDRNATRIPPQSVLFATLRRAMMVLNATEINIHSRVTKDSGDLIDRLLTGLDTVELSPKDLALLEAYLKQPLLLERFQRKRATTGSSQLQEEHNKLKFILDYNRNLQQVATTSNAPQGIAEANAAEVDINSRVTKDTPDSIVRSTAKSDTADREGLVEDLPDKASFPVKDRWGEHTLVVPPTEPAWSGDPTGIVPDIEAQTRTGLRDEENPNSFRRLYKDFHERSNPADGVSFTEYARRRHADKIDTQPAERDTETHAQDEKELSSGGKTTKQSAETPEIRFPNPSPPLSKKAAVAYWGGDMTVKKLTGLMKSGRIQFHELNRQTFIFCRDNVPNLPTK